MRKKLLLAAAFGVAAGAVVAVLVLSPAPAFAATGTIISAANNPHNFSSGSGNLVISSEARKCDFCHTPHNSSITALGATLPLWNRDDAAVGGYTPYGDPQSTIEAGALLDGTLGGQSMACMSCHDGSLELDDLVNFPNPWAVQTDVPLRFPDVATRIGGDQLLAANPAFVGLNLTFDHPVGITYVDTADMEDLPIAAGFLFGGVPDQVECASCHNPHNHYTGTDQEPFLRATMADSLLCGTCHIK